MTHVRLAGLGHAELGRIRAAALSLQHRRLETAYSKGKIGRNDACPCGSGWPKIQAVSWAPRVASPYRAALSRHHLVRLANGGFAIPTQLFLGGVIGGLGAFPADHRSQDRWRLLRRKRKFRTDTLPPARFVSGGRAAIGTEAQIIAYIDDFQLLMYPTIAAFPLLLFFARAQPNEGESPTVAPLSLSVFDFNLISRHAPLRPLCGGGRCCADHAFGSPASAISAAAARARSAASRAISAHSPV